MPRRKVAKTYPEDEDFVSTVLEQLQSQGVLEQLRLECLADVMSKRTYLQLKERMENYITKKMTQDWVSDSTFREQVIECSVIALTIERIVGEVVKRKLREEMRSMVIHMIKEVMDESTISKLNGSVLETPASSTSSYKKTAEVVQMICRETKRKTKILADGSFGRSLASVSFSHSTESDEDCMSDASENTDMSFSSSPKVQSPEIRNSKQTDEPDVKPVINGSQDFSGRLRRERKMNPKYSSAVYHTSYTPQAAAAVVTSTPKKEKEKLPAEDTSPNTADTSNNFKKVPSKRKSPEKAKSAPSTEVQVKLEKPDIPPDIEKLPVAVKSAPVFKRKHTRSKFSPKKEDEEEDHLNGSIRKSSRPRKINSRLFSDYVPPYATKELRVFLSATETETRPDHNGSFEMKQELIAEVTRVQNIEIEESPNVQSSAHHSSKRYESSDLYKPRYTSSSASRAKRAHH